MPVETDAFLLAAVRRVGRLSSDQKLALTRTVSLWNFMVNAMACLCGYCSHLGRSDATAFEAGPSRLATLDGFPEVAGWKRDTKKRAPECIFLLTIDQKPIIISSFRRFCRAEFGVTGAFFKET